MTEWGAYDALVLVIAYAMGIAVGLAATYRPRRRWVLTRREETPQAVLLTWEVNGCVRHTKAWMARAAPEVPSDA